MVGKILGFLFKETRSLNQAAFLLGLFAFLSQVLAFLRDRLLAHIFGASLELDIYYAAFRVPDFIFVTVASVVSLSVLIPFIIEREALGLREIRNFVNTIFTFFSGVIVIVCAAAFFLLPYFSSLLFKGFTPEAILQVVFISRVLLLSPIILGFSNLFGSVTQSYNRYTVYALAPLLYNAGIVAGIIFLSERVGILGVALGVILGASMHLLIQAPFVVKSGLFPRLNLGARGESGFDWGVVLNVVKISFPRTLTLSMSSIGLIFLVSLASLMVAGSISIFTFSSNLQSVPLSIIGVSYSLAAFPTLSRYFKQNNIEAFIEQVITTAKFIIFWTLPTSALFIVLRAQIVRVILGTGRFNWDDTRLTAACLALFVLSSVFQCLLLLFIRGFYSAGFTKRPFFMNLAGTFILVVGTWGLVKLFYLSEIFRFFVSVLLKVQDLPGTAVLMLPLGFSIATAVNGIIHWISFEREFRGFSRPVLRTLFESFGTSVIMGGVAYIGLNIFDSVFDTTTLLGIFLQGLCAGLLAIVSGIMILSLLKSSELREIWSALKGKFWRAKIIATDPEIV